MPIWIDPGIVAVVADRCVRPKKAVATILSSFIDHVRDCMFFDENVRIDGIGTLRPAHRAERNIISVTTGQPCRVAAHRTVYLADSVIDESVEYTHHALSYPEEAD